MVNHKFSLQLSIIIPTFNNFDGLSYQLDYFKDKSYQLIIIDNKQDKKNKDLVKKFENYQVVSYLPQDKNLGFAAAVNLGAKDVQTKWMLILNDDIEFDKVYKVAKFIKLKSKKVYKEKKTVERLINFAEENKLDAVSPILRNPDGRIENVGYKVLAYGKVELVKRLTGLRVNELDGLTAACLLIKTSVFKKLKGFDEKFFAYLEDVDFFLRFKKAGYQMGIAADIDVLHNHMTTSKTMGSFKARQDMINWWRLYFKHREKFKFDLDFIVERLRNVMGYIKATLNNIFHFSIFIFQ